MAQPRVLVVDDEPAILTIYRRLFRREFAIESAASGSEGLALLEQHTFDVALVDYSMPLMTGLQMIRAAARTTHSTWWASR